MELVAGYTNYGTDADLDYTLYSFVLTAAQLADDLGNHDQDVALLEASRLLKQRAIGVWRSEEHDNIIYAQLQSLTEAAETLLTANGFDIEWIDGYSIYWTYNVDINWEV